MAKLSSYNFDLMYIPGPKNSVADALSHDPFTSISRRLIQEPYSNLVQEADGGRLTGRRMLLELESNTFRWSSKQSLLQSQ